jgi:hypothetical protein
MITLPVHGARFAPGATLPPPPEPGPPVPGPEPVPPPTPGPEPSPPIPPAQPLPPHPRTHERIRMWVGSGPAFPLG